MTQNGDSLRVDLSFCVQIRGRVEAAGGEVFTLRFEDNAARGLLPQALATVKFSFDQPATLSLMEPLLGSYTSLQRARSPAFPAVARSRWLARMLPDRISQAILVAGMVPTLARRRRGAAFQRSRA